jgi:exopolysaccharide biosynthesis polyprenyl glycosylphosphotransferase
MMDSIIPFVQCKTYGDPLALPLAPRRPRTDLTKVADQTCSIDQPCILGQLRHEIQRAHRSGSALSVLVVDQFQTNRTGTEAIRGLLKSIQLKTRETDVAGYISQHKLAVLLPYSNGEGVNKIKERIMAGYTAPQITITTSTYPDQLFDSLTEIGCVSPDALRLIVEDSIQNSWLKLRIKRGVDVVGSILALLILSPLMLLAAVLVKYSSPGPAIFRQTRLGHKGIPFTFYKFRSMRRDVNDQIHRDYISNFINGNPAATNNGDKENPLYKIKSDPRVTRVGEFIRKTSIDELPQLYNVLKGDMSLVGPRPPLAYEAEKYHPWQLRRILDMKPGITGLWQVEGRSRVGFDEAVRQDICYIKTWSLWLDIKILCKTVKVVLQCRGAV